MLNGSGGESQAEGEEGGERKALFLLLQVLTGTKGAETVPRPSGGYTQSHSPSSTPWRPCCPCASLEFTSLPHFHSVTLSICLNSRCGISELLHQQCALASSYPVWSWKLLFEKISYLVPIQHAMAYWGIFMFLKKNKKQTYVFFEQLMFQAFLIMIGPWFLAFKQNLPPEEQTEMLATFSLFLQIICRVSQPISAGETD